MIKTIQKLKKDHRKICVKDLRQIRGFTLIELLVALAVFSIVVVVILDVFLMGLGGTKRIFGRQNIQESGRFIMESMSKEIRMSRINTPVGGPLDSVNITNSKTPAQTLNYSLDNINKTISRAGEQLNPNEIEVTGNFYVQKDSDSAQPRVTIVLVLRNKTDKAREQSEINLQTTISSRNYAQ